MNGDRIRLIAPARAIETPIILALVFIKVELSTSSLLGGNQAVPLVSNIDDEVIGSKGKTHCFAQRVFDFSDPHTDGGSGILPF